MERSGDDEKTGEKCGNDEFDVLNSKNGSKKRLAKSLSKLLADDDDYDDDDTVQADKAITLDDLLNMWDGIRETPGRIIVITSNFYHKLDKALVRPGRIDIEIETTREDAAEFSAITTGETPTCMP